MSKECKFCGAEMADDAVQCPECEKFVPGYEASKRRKKEKSMNAKRTAVFAAIIVAAVVLLFVIITAVANVIVKNSEEADSDYAKVFDRYTDALINVDYDEYLGVFPDFYANEVNEMFSYLSGSGTEYLQMLNDKMTEQFGALNGITYEINSEGVANDDKIADYKDEWVNLYGLSEKAKVSAVYIIDADFTVSGRKLSDDINQNVMLAKIDGKWYLMNIMYLFDTSGMTTAS